jgi:1-acyl-sn-glycerol-3-phosphate acyltransferase
MLAVLRAGWRALAVLVLTVAALILLTPAALLPERARGRVERLTFRSWSRALCRVMGMRVVVEGPPPRAPFFLVANHLSYVDVILLASRLPCVFVARADVRRWPLFGLACRAVRTIFIDREQRRDVVRVIAGMRRTLDSGRGVVVFPEGTSTPGLEVAPFKASLLEIATGADLAVHFAALSYRAPAGWPPAWQSVCWWGDMPFLGHLLALLQLPRFEARVTFGESAIGGLDRKRLAAELRRAVAAKRPRG